MAPIFTKSGNAFRPDSGFVSFRSHALHTRPPLAGRGARGTDRSDRARRGEYRWPNHHLRGRLRHPPRAPQARRQADRQGLDGAPQAEGLPLHQAPLARRLRPLPRRPDRTENGQPAATSSASRTPSRSPSPSTSAAARTSSSATARTTPATRRAPDATAASAAPATTSASPARRTATASAAPATTTAKHGNGSDGCWGGPGNDICIMGRGHDGCHGEGGNDRLYGGPVLRPALRRPRARLLRRPPRLGQVPQLQLRPPSLSAALDRPFPIGKIRAPAASRSKYFPERDNLPPIRPGSANLSRTGKWNLPAYRTLSSSDS